MFRGLRLLWLQNFRGYENRVYILVGPVACLPSFAKKRPQSVDQIGAGPSRALSVPFDFGGLELTDPVRVGGRHMMRGQRTNTSLEHRMPVLFRPSSPQENRAI